MTFSLKIELGNDAMQDAYHVADALRNVAEAVEAAAGDDSGTIRDENGNTVGSWTLKGAL